jgi:hypothetical protein
VKKTKNIPNVILYHVGGVHPEGSEMVLIPGCQAAQGRGVYASEEPRIKYAGGEGYHNDTGLPPVFIFPACGTWKVSTSHKSGIKSYNSLSSLVLLTGIKKRVDFIDGQKCLIYEAESSTLIKEWDVSVNGRNMFSPFADAVRSGAISQQDACEIAKGHETAVS